MLAPRSKATIRLTSLDLHPFSHCFLPLNDFVLLAICSCITGLSLVVSQINDVFRQQGTHGRKLQDHPFDECATRD